MTPSPHASAFDTGPLSWVVGEIRGALERSGSALNDAATRSSEAQPTLLLHAKTHLHQAHGALQMVDVEGVGLLTAAAERALDGFKERTLACTPESARTVRDAYGAIAEYLDELVAGLHPQPLRLFPYHRALQELLGAERIHPSDLLAVDTGITLDLPEAPDASAPDYASCRARFEKALLPYLKSPDAAAQRSNAGALFEAISPLADARLDARARTAWAALRSFARLVAAGSLPGDLYVKQLFGQVNLQLRRLSQGQLDLPEAMLRDALFFIAAAETVDGEAASLRQAFRLQGAVPPDYAERRYGKVDPGALKEAKEALARAKSGWDALALQPDATREADFREALALLAAAGEQLGTPALARLLRELAQAGDSLAALASNRGDGFGLDMAGALLFVEQGLDHVRHLPADFEAHAQAVGQRLLALAAGETPPDAPHWPQWQTELARRVQQGQTVAVLAGEIKSGLRQVEKLLDEYYEAPQAKRSALVRAAPLLHQVQGALSILDQDEAARAAQHVREAVQVLADGDGDVQAQAATLHKLARNIGALGFFTDMLAQDSDSARGRFAFDAAAGLLQELNYGQAAGQGVAQEPVAAPVAPEPEAQAEPAIDAELLEIFVLEAGEVLATVAGALPGLQVDPAAQDALTIVRRAFHTLKGSARMVDLEAFAAASAAIERTLNLWLADSRAATPDLLALAEHAHAQLAPWVAELAQAGASGRDGAELIAAAERVQAGGRFAAAVPEAAGARPLAPLDDSMRRVGTLDIPLALYNIYVAETDELVRLLERDFGEWRHEAGRPASGEALTAVHTLAGTSATVGFVALRDLAYSFEATLGMLAAPAPTLHPGQHDVFDTVLACVRQMLAAFARGELAPAQPDVIEQLDALRDALTAQQAAAAYGDAAPGLARELDTLFAQAYDSLVADPPLASTTPAVSPQVDEQPAATEPVDELFGLDFDDLFDAPSLAPAAPVDEPEVAPQAGPQAIERPVALPATPMPATEPVPHDELDSDLLPVFLEEAADLLPQIGNGLRQWQQNPLDTAPAQGLLRTLHTVKGSARMAGAMRIGQHTHELETQVENMVHAGTTLPAAFDELMASYDQALALYEQLVQPPQAMGDGDGDAVPASGLPAADAAVPPEARTPLVRVRADILDRLVTQAGEVSITRSRLENQMGVLKGALSDFSDHLNRLRRQLREVEMQAESQIASRMSIAGEREFDPLEFDRFTRLQELTRMMAESVNDVASFHESLSRTVDGAGEELAAQARMTRDLQRDLMRVRMVPFASLSERLFRVARQTAKETDKRVNLDIRGGAVEIDRSVLEQMAAPFEHLLRNAIVHGIEPRGLRVASGKPETGELLVQVSQQGNEVVLQFSDDGAGLDLERIRAKARLLGMAAGDAGLSDRLTDVEAAELIFAPGFSTADTLTELAGRGVGMDVVRSEAQSLGGRVAIATEAGRGVRFTIRLPLTLAVAQVVLVASAGKTYALPSNLVEQVVQVREPELAAAAEAGMLEVAGQVLPFHYLPALLGEGEAFEPGLRSRSVMVLHSAGERIALQVDDVLGNREVVIKNLGPQLARVPGIAGATVLGTGDIVLILNPLALGRHAGTGRPAPAKMAGEPLPHRPTVMVVDDSLTVRRVTQRLLEREGYRVALAKDGVDALAQLPGVRPDLMLVDIEMPRMDGFDLVRHVRNDAATSAIPIIMITSRTADKHRNVALGLGVNAYFGKPYQEPVLLGAIAGLLNREMPET